MWRSISFCFPHKLIIEQQRTDSVLLAPLGACFRNRPRYMQLFLDSSQQYVHQGRSLQFPSKGGKGKESSNTVTENGTTAHHFTLTSELRGASLLYCRLIVIRLDKIKSTVVIIYDAQLSTLIPLMAMVHKSYSSLQKGIQQASRSAKLYNCKTSYMILAIGKDSLVGKLKIEKTK